MTTTNINGVLETNDGVQHHLEGEPTDASNTELKIKDISGSLVSFKDIIRGKTINRVAIQCSDGSILTTVYIQEAGATIRSYYFGERVASSKDIYNCDIKGINIPVSNTTILYVNCGD